MALEGSSQLVLAIIKKGSENNMLRGEEKSPDRRKEMRKNRQNRQTGYYRKENETFADVPCAAASLTCQ